MYRAYSKNPNCYVDFGDFQLLVKSGVSEVILGLISGSLPDDQKVFICMKPLPTINNSATRCNFFFVVNA